MEIGSRIRFYRIQQNMTQEELSRGIISTSYLSKIENNQTTASIEVLDFLCSRLKINLIEEEEIPLMKSLFDWYHDIVHRRQDTLKKRYEELREKIHSTSDTTAMLYFVLFEFRYLLTERDFAEAEAKLEKISLYKDIFEEKMTYYYEKFVGLHHYLQSKYSSALMHLKGAERFLTKHLPFEKWEEADLYYSIALTLSQLRKAALVIQYTHFALNIYQSRYDLMRCAECQILLGINYLRCEEYEKSEESYHLSMKLAQQLNHNGLLGMVYHNLGFLKSTNDLYEEAIQYYKDGLKLKGEPESLNTVFSILYAYYQLGEKDESKKWLEKGRELLAHNDRSEYSYHFKIYNYLLNEQLNDEFESFMKEEAIPYFLDHEKLHYIVEYSEIMANFYEERHRYKAAVVYYNIIKSSLKKTLIN
ncbi:helix-turn-helix domain-containing protein [Metabacillus indicus]|uniref:helix-turn-helix domain-containing protein n=1 Tax=Metabacillus indicus TaxID=246786 RepID=UPI003CED1866